MVPVRNDIRLALLTNFVPPMRLLVYSVIAQQVRLKVFIDARTESNRLWPVEHGNLDVEVVASRTILSTYNHPVGYRDTAYVYLPLGLMRRLLGFKPSHIISGELGMRTGIACLYRLLNRDT